MAKRKFTKGMDLTVIRTDNGPQFINKKFGDTCKSLGLKHRRIPVKTPNMNAYIKSFHSALEKDCYGINEFNSYIHVYKAVSKYMNYYNNRYRHGSLGDMSPADFYQAIQDKKIKPEHLLHKLKK